MKSKELSNFKLVMIIILIIVGLTIFLLAILTIGGKFDTFNPDEDVCIDDERQVVCLDEGWQTFKEGCNNIDTIFIKCNEWRPKTICELDPNAEGCICEETKERFIGYNSEWRTKHFGSLEEFENYTETPCGDVVYVFRTGKRYLYLEDDWEVYSAFKDELELEFIRCEWQERVPITKPFCIKAHEERVTLPTGSETK